MRSSKKAINIPAIIVFAAMLALFAGTREVPAQEHPHEHPTSKKAELTKESLAEAIASYIEDDSELKGGFFLVYDKEQGKALALKLDKVHEDRLATLGNGNYFACADFNGTDGSVYDLDVFMKEKRGDLKVYDISVHKKDGEARYGWVEKDGVWSKSAK